MRKILASLLVLLATLAIASLVYLIRDIYTDMVDYIHEVGVLERRVITGVPIYDDFTSPEKENKLRAFLQQDHIAAAEKAGTGPVSDDKQLEELIKAGDIVTIDPTPTSLYFFYNVRKSRRYLTSSAAAGLQVITERFQKKLNSRTAIPPVKIAVSSALRTSSQQHNLGKRNLNATVLTTHSYGTSFDIFYDEYFMTPPCPGGANLISRSIYGAMKSKMGYLLGASLRRQFHSMLMETLMELQDEGMIYAILERRQRCYHVTVLKND